MKNKLFTSYSLFLENMDQPVNGDTAIATLDAVVVEATDFLLAKQNVSQTGPYRFEVKKHDGTTSVIDLGLGKHNSEANGLLKITIFNEFDKATGNAKSQLGFSYTVGSSPTFKYKVGDVDAILAALKLDLEKQLA
jgi:hypothetical protein